jgi:hypothetical protein
MMRKKRRQPRRWEYERWHEQTEFDRERERERLRVLRIIAEADESDRRRLEDARRYQRRRTY